MIDVDHVDYQPKLSKPGQVAKHQCPMTCVTYCVATMTYFSVVTTAVSAITKHVTTRSLNVNIRNASNVTFSKK